MSAFIHGEIAWSHAGAESRVRTMLAPLNHQPWKVTDVQTARRQDPTVALASQHNSEAGHFGPHGTGEVLIAADLHPLETAGGDGRPSTIEHRIADLYERRDIDAFAHEIPATGVLALWDSRRRRLVCWRDVAGTRPLYVFSDPGRRVVFSSDLRSMAAHPFVQTEIDLGYTRALIEVGPHFQHPRRTLYRDIFKLEAGHTLVVDRSGISMTKYWDATEVPELRHRCDADYVDHLRSLLSETITSGFDNGTAPIASHLSGGLDSSSIAVLAARAAADQGRELRAMSWAPPWSDVARLDHDERDLVESVSRFADLPVHYTTISTDDQVELQTRNLASHPMTTLQAELSASRAAAASGVRTILSGWGGDELVVYNGKGYLPRLARSGHWRTMWREIGMRADIHKSSRLSNLRGRVLLPLLPDRVAYRLRPGLAPMPLKLPEDYLRPDVLAALRSTVSIPYPTIRERVGVRPLQIAKLEYGHLQYRMESWAAHGADIGIIYRFPLLDRRLIEFALGLPDDLYFKNGWKRWLYRTATAGILPDNVRWNPDKFDLALSASVNTARHDARDAIRERFRTCRDNPYVDVDRLLRHSQTYGPDVGSAGFLAFTDAKLSD